MSNQKPSLVAPLSGVVVGIGVFLGVNLTIGHAVIPTPESVVSVSHGLSAPAYVVDQAASAAGGASEGAYQTVCKACHQDEGQGVPGAFPPLAGSEWLTADPETPIRVVLLGLAGPIEVKGLKFSSVMPPPPGMTDEKIAEAVTFARSHFGNKASPVDVAMVKAVRASLAGRTQSWSPAELSALRTVAAAPAPVEPAAAEPAAVEPPPAAARKAKATKAVPVIKAEQAPVAAPTKAE